MKKCFFLILCLCLSSVVRAQAPTMVPVEISESPVGFLGMVQDKYGYIWLSDNGSGLYKFDGKTTTHFKSEPANPNSLSSDRIENVIIDSEGILWLAHFDAGIDRFDSEAEIFTQYVHDERDTTTLCSNGVRDIIEDLDGNLWVGTATGLDKFDRATGEFNHDFSSDPDATILRQEHIRKLYLDKSGIVWIGTGSAFFGEETKGGLFSLNPKTGEINLYRHTDKENSLIDNRVRAIFEDSRGVLWIGTAEDGLHTMDRGNGTFTRHTYDAQQPEKLSRPEIQNIFAFGVDHITFIGEDNQRNIWIGTFGNGINRYNPITKITDHYGPDKSGSFKTDNASYWTFLKSSDGLLWFASFNSGNHSKLSKMDISPRKLRYYAHNNITSFKQDKDSTLYFGTLDGVQVLDHDDLKYVFRTYDTKEENRQTVRSISLDRFGNIWAGTEDAGLFTYNKETRELRNYRHEIGNENSLSSDHIGSILIQDNGEIIVGTSAGLDILNPRNSLIQHFELENELLNDYYPDYPKFIVMDGQKRIWVGRMGGIFRFEREKGIFVRYHLGLGSEFINHLFVDLEGIVWASTINHGLRRYNGKNDSFESILDETGFLSKYLGVMSITQDLNADIWISTYRLGLIKYDRERKQGTRFEADLIPVNGQFLFTDHVNTLLNGEILLIGQSGYTLFHPNSLILPDSAIQKPFIEKLIIGEEVLSASDDNELYNSFRTKSAIRLSSDQNDLSFEIGYIDFENDQTVSYKLENYHEEWRTVTSGNAATYYQLPPGQYSLIMKAQDTYGNWGEMELSIQIDPPWYKTLWAYILYAIILIAGVILVDRHQRKRLLDKAMAEAREKELIQAKEIEKAYYNLEVAHENLKSTQALLIQSEKMASLGELTAGIAHEIQNPLNFVNNFSQVSNELLDEMHEELGNGDIEEAKAISSDIKQNLEKINHHGQRASSIVKGMLEHSRTGDGKKEPTDINKLADEYLRLAYHGIRAKDKSFSADFKTDLDESLPKIDVVPQDIGRVLLNLINNAFYVVDKKAKSGIEYYKPEVTVRTKKGMRVMEISVTDNGEGIPAEIKDKIFQPFFTTKPTGSGTGLGLSLSYDIVKAHGGELKVESEVGEGSEFTIRLPYV